jgi:hypothetical protein
MMPIDQGIVQMTVKRWKLEKFEGDKQPGDGKTPTEILIGGDDVPTRHLTPDDPEFASQITKET